MWYLQLSGVVPILMNTVVCTVVACDTKSHSSTRYTYTYMYLAKQPVKIRSVSSSKIQMMLGKWREVSPEQLLPLIGRFICRNAKKHGVAISNELKEYLELLKASAAATVSEDVGSS